MLNSKQPALLKLVKVSKITDLSNNPLSIAFIIIEYSPET